MSFYRAKNKRLIKRGAGGRFRETTLADLGAGCCKECGKFYAFDSSVVMAGPFVDPNKMAKHKTTCADCMKKEKK
jgi:hypothetical protein